MVGILDHSGSEALCQKFSGAAAQVGLYPHGLVMPAADRNLAVIKLQERPTLGDIIHIMWQVMLPLMNMHGSGAPWVLRVGAYVRV